MRYPSIVVDFDKTLTYEDIYPAVGEINLHAIDILRKYQSQGGKVILCTAREGNELSAALEALFENDFYPDAVNDNLPERVKLYGKNCRKIMGEIFIDDRCAYFTKLGRVDWDMISEMLEVS